MRRWLYALRIWLWICVHTDTPDQPKSLAHNARAYDMRQAIDRGEL
jgi:hypothetical protein